MTTLTAEVPIVMSNLRVNSNNAADWLDWIRNLIAGGHLEAGDILICDNATIHTASSIIDDMQEALDNANVRLVTLPTYSPELNPCELVFAQAKSMIRRNRTSEPFWLDIMVAFSLISRKNVLSYYAKCLFDPF